jgi:hypothetical protein
MDPRKAASRMTQLGRFRLILQYSSLHVSLLLFCAGCGHGLSSSDTVEFKSEAWKFKNAEGQKLTTAHYVIYTTCKSKTLVRTLPGFLESCFEAYAKLIPPDKEPDNPLPTYFFATRWQWERFTEEFTGPRAPVYKRIRSGGYSENGTTVSYYGSQRASLSILAHEGFHQYLEMTRGENIPAWANEGLACYFESFDLDTENKPIFKPEKNYLRIPALREGIIGKSLIPLKEILSTHAGLAVQQNLNHVQNYYAQEWSIIVFMMQDTMANPYHKGFKTLLKELGKPDMDRKARAFLAADTDGKMSYGEAVFRAYITEDLDTFQHDYEEFLHQFLILKG